MQFANQDDFPPRDWAHMREAFAEAEIALANGEVPVGCVLVDDATQEIIARGRNDTNRTCNATRHAEMTALESCGALQLDQRRSVSVYVTLEPCIMCAGALAMAGVQRIVYGAGNDKFGGCGSVLDVCRSFPLERGIRPFTECVAGLGANEAIGLLQRFYMRTNDKAPQPRRDGMKERVAKRQELVE